MKEISISKNDSGQRFDKYLLKYFNKANKSFVYKMLRKKRIKLNGSRAEGCEMLSEGDIIQMYLAEDTMDSFMEEKKISKTEIKFDIVYEDDNIIVVNKPSGVLSHAESKDDNDTLIDQILSYLNDKGEYIPEKSSTFTPALCNRLDRNTSGIVVAGKTSDAVRQLNEAIKNKKICKYYRAIVCKRIDKGGRLENLYAKDGDKNKAAISDSGKKIITAYEPIVFNEKYSLLEIELITGKSHQIRLHMQSIGAPILGDMKYGNAEENKKLKVKYQLLHAYKMEFNALKDDLEYLNGKVLIAEVPGTFKKAEINIFNKMY